MRDNERNKNLYTNDEFHNIEFHKFHEFHNVHEFHNIGFHFYRTSDTNNFF